MALLSNILSSFLLFFGLIAVFVWIKPLFPFLDQLGYLPGDRILRVDELYVYLPIVSSLYLSLILTLIDYFFCFIFYKQREYHE